MNDPTTNYEFGKALHKEYESQAGGQWKVKAVKRERKIRLAEAKKLLLLYGVMTSVLVSIVWLMR